MHIKKQFFLSALVLASVSIISFGSITNSVHAQTPPAVNLSAVSAVVPVHISIASGKVTAQVINVGITNTGNLATPPNFVQTGWYKYGTVPGQQGSAVIDGHVDNGASIPGPFKNLKNVKVGDDITVTMSDGKVLHFSIINTSIYPTNNFPSNLVFNQKGNAYLKLITCNGTFVPALGTYDKRLVVTAVLDTP